MKTTLVKSQNDAVTLAWISQSNTFHADIYKRSTLNIGLEKPCLNVKIPLMSESYSGLM